MSKQNASSGAQSEALRQSWELGRQRQLAPENQDSQSVQEFFPWDSHADFVADFSLLSVGRSVQKILPQKNPLQNLYNKIPATFLQRGRPTQTSEESAEHKQALT